MSFPFWATHNTVCVLEDQKHTLHINPNVKHHCESITMRRHFTPAGAGQQIRGDGKVSEAKPFRDVRQGFKSIVRMTLLMLTPKRH